jgi:hypothetical protein
MSKIKWFLFIIVGLLGFMSSVLAAPGVIRAGDLVSIWVKGEPDLSVERQVNRDGSISLPLVGSVGVNGLKTNDAARLIAGMLEDGFLRDPLVQVSIKSSGNASPAGVARKKRPEKRGPAYEENAVVHQEATQPSRQPEQKQLLIEVIDATTLEGIGGVAMMLGNRIYQSNRLGQILIDSSDGHAIIIADGFQTVSGSLGSLLNPGNPAKIHIRRIQIAEAITFKVVDAFTRKPLSGVEITLDDMKVSTNRQGTFKVRLIKKEFGEINLRRKGYRTHRQVIDYKGPEEQLIMMVRNE